MNTKTITVKTNEENPEPVEIIADALIKISEAFGKMKDSRLTKRALLLLIHDNCGMAGKFLSPEETYSCSNRRSFGFGGIIEKSIYQGN